MCMLDSTSCKIGIPGLPWWCFAHALLSVCFAFFPSTKSTTADFATKLFEKARVATLSSSTSRYFEELVQVEAEEAANAASTRRRTKKKPDVS